MSDVRVPMSCGQGENHHHRPDTIALEWYRVWNAGQRDFHMAATSDSNRHDDPNRCRNSTCEISNLAASVANDEQSPQT